MFAMLYTISWRTVNGFEGGGTRLLTLEEGNNWLTYLRDKYPNDEHWLCSAD